MSERVLVVVVLPNREISIEFFRKVTRLLNWHAGLNWREKDGLEIREEPNLRDLSIKDRAKTREDWLEDLSSKMINSNWQGTLIFYAQSKLGKTLRARGSLAGNGSLTIPSNKHQFEDCLSKALKRARLDAMSGAVEMLDKWNFKDISISSSNKLEIWLRQFKTVSSQKAGQFLLRCMRLLQVSELLARLNFPKLIATHAQGPYFLIGANSTSDESITGSARRLLATQNSFMEFQSWPNNGDLWQTGNTTAIIVSDWLQSGWKLSQQMTGQLTGVSSTKLTLVKLAENRERRLIIHLAWATRFAIERITWLAKQHGVTEGQVEFSIANTCILENLSQPPEFIGFGDPVVELSSLKTECEVLAIDLLSAGESDVLNVLKANTATFWPERANEPDLCKMGICSFWEFSCGEHNHPMLVRRGDALDADMMHWEPLLINALKDG